MKPPRFHLAWAMILIAVLALNLGVIRALYDEMEEHLLFDALPMANVMAVVGIAGFRRRAYAFILGFAVTVSLSMLAYQTWSCENPWTWLRIFEPPFQAIDRGLEAVFSDAHVAILHLVIIVVFAIPHAVLGLAGGYMTGKGWAIVRRKMACGRVAEAG